MIKVNTGIAFIYKDARNSNQNCYKIKYFRTGICIISLCEHHITAISALPPYALQKTAVAKYM